MNPNHTYINDGVYQVTFTVTDNDGNVSNDTITMKTFGAVIDEIDHYIQNLPDNAFKNNPKQRKKALSNKLNAVHNQIEAENYNGAKIKPPMAFGLRWKFDHLLR